MRPQQFGMYPLNRPSGRCPAFLCLNSLVVSGKGQGAQMIRILRARLTDACTYQKRADLKLESSIKSVKHERLEQLDSLRAIAILMVMYAHWMPPKFNPNFLSLGGCGVT